MEGILQPIEITWKLSIGHGHVIERLRRSRYHPQPVAYCVALYSWEGLPCERQWQRKTSTNPNS